MPNVGVLLGGVAIVAGLAAWGFYERGQAIKFHAAAAVAEAANLSNQRTIDRLESDLVIAQAEAIADAEARRKGEAQADELEKAFLAAKGGPCAGLDALIEQRRLQRQGGGGADPRH